MNKVYTISELTERLTPVFENAPIYKAVLFGSYAKGEADETSDIDIVIYSNWQIRDMKIFGVLADIREASGKAVDLFDESYIKEDSKIFNAIHNEGVVIYER